MYSGVIIIKFSEVLLEKLGEGSKKKDGITLLGLTQ